MNEGKLKETASQNELKLKKSSKADYINTASSNSMNNNDNSLSYGCLVSLAFDYYESNPLTTLSYDEEKEKKKLREINKLCDEKTKSKSKDYFASLLNKNVKRKIEHKNEIKDNNKIEKEKDDSTLKKSFFNNVFKNAAMNNKGESGKKLCKSISKNNLFSNENKLTNYKKIVQNFSEKSCFYSKGIFSDQLIFYKYSSIQDIQLNYKNSLFKIIPAGEYESKQKLKKIIKDLVKSSKEETGKDLNYNYYKDYFAKYKQEILSNHQNYIKFISKRAPINFDDNIHLIHLQTGKFLKFKKNPDDLKTYMKLSYQPCRHTIFRIKPGFNFQTEFSTNIFFNLTINIACGDKVANREMFIANPNFNINQQQNNFMENMNENFKQNSIRIFDKILHNEEKESDLNLNFSSYEEKEYEGIKIKQNNNSRINQSKKLSNFINEAKHKIYKFTENAVIADNKSFNRWKFNHYSNNLEEDEKFLNNLDMFWIQNCEKDVYIISMEEDKINAENKNINDRITILTTDSSQNNNNNNNLSFNFQSKLIDKEEKYPIIIKKENLNEEDIILKRYSTLLQANNLVNNSTNILNNSSAFNNNQMIGNSINFFSFDHLNYSHKLKMSLALKNLELSDINNPMGIFCFEPITREILKDNFYSIDLPPKIGPINYKNLFRIRNVITNLIVSIEHNDSNPHNPGLLKLVKSSEIRNADECLFTIEPVNDKKDRNEENQEEINFTKNGNFIRKLDMLRIRSKKYKSYLAIRTVQNDNRNFLILTKNLSDLTIFKFDFLNYEDKLILNFFEQLNSALDFLLTYYARIKNNNGNSNNIIVSANNNNQIKTYSTLKSNNNLEQIDQIEIEDVVQYQKMKTIFTKLKKMLKEYKNNTNTEDSHKIDIIKNLKVFNVIEKLVKIVLSIWFKINFDKENNTNQNCKIECQQDFKNILKNNISEKLGLKIECTNLVLKILKISYDLDNSNIIFIENNFHHFFKFAGKLNYCTKFLIYIMRNNKSLLLKLFSIDNLNNSINQIKECVKSLFYENVLYNSNNFDSIILFFELLNIMLICNDEAFRPFFKEILLDLELFIEYDDEEDKKVYLKPNSNLFFLVEFEYKNDRIYFKKKFHGRENENENEKSIQSEDIKSNNFDNTFFIKEDDIMIENLDENMNENEFINNDIYDRNSDHIFKTYDINFSDFESEKGIEKENLIKLITQNIILFSNIAMNDDRFKFYLSKIFKIEVVNQYLVGYIITQDGDSIAFNLNEDIKCALIRMTNNLYLKKPDDNIESLNLCRKINDNKNDLKIMNKNSLITKKTLIFDYSLKGMEIEKIMKNVEDKLIDHITRKKVLSQAYLLQIVESCQFIIRHIYNKHLDQNLEFNNDKEIIFKFVSLLMIILENFVGMNTYNMSRKYSRTYFNYNSNNSTNINSNNSSDEARELLLQLLKNEKLTLNKINSNQSENNLSHHSQTSPYLKLYEIVKRKFISALNAIEKTKNNKTVGQTGKFGSFLNLSTISKNFTDKEKENPINPKSNLETINSLNLIPNPNLKKNSHNQNSKEIKSEILKRVCKIFIEFLKFVENGYVHEIEKNIVLLIQDKDIGNNKNTIDYSNLNEIINKKIFKFNENNNELDFMNLLDEFAIFHLNKKREFRLIPEDFYTNDKKLKSNSTLNNNPNNNLSNFQNLNKLKPKQEEHRITNVFLECLQRLDDMNLKMGIFEIFYRMNSQKLILFENVSNLVILSKTSDVEKYEDLKNFISNLNLEITNLSTTSERDDVIKILLNKVNQNLINTIKILYDRSKLTVECEDIELYTYENQINLITERSLKNTKKLKNKDSENSENLSLDEEEDNDYFSQSNNVLKKKDNLENENYFIQDFSPERIRFVQYILKNLGLDKIIIKFLIKVKEIISKKISEIDLNISKMKQTIECLSETLDNLYILLAIFVKNNLKHKFILEEDIEIVLYPVLLSKEFGIKFTKSISLFLLEFLKDFKISNLNNSEKFIEMITLLMHDINWREQKELIPYWVEILKIILKTNTIDTDERLIVCLDTIKKALIIDLVNNRITKNESFYLKEILRIFIYLKRINLEDYENKVKFIFPLYEIMSILDTMKSEDQNFSFEIINLTVDYLYSNHLIYKNELANSKQLLRKLENSLLYIYNKYKQENGIKLEYIYMKNDSHKKEYFLHLNIFIGVSIPKLHFVVNDVSSVEQIRKSIKDNLNSFINLSDSLFYSILEYIKQFDESEILDFIKDKCFLSFVNMNELFRIANSLVNSLPHLIEIFQKYNFENVLFGPYRNFTQNSNNDNFIELKTRNDFLNTNPVQHMSAKKLNNMLTDSSKYDTQLWCDIREILNSPQSIIEHLKEEVNLNHNDKGLFFQKINLLVNQERQNLIRNIIVYIKKFDELSNNQLNNNESSNPTLMDPSKNKNSQSVNNSLIKIMNSVFSNYLDKNEKVKQQFYFYFTLIIHYMNFNVFSENFEDFSVSRNKEVLSDSKFFNIIIKFLRNKNEKNTDYSIALIMKFFTTYLQGLEDKKKIDFYEFLMNNAESESLFKIMKNIIQNFKSKLLKDSRDFSLGNSKINSKNSENNFISMSKSVNFDLTKYENIINPYEEVVKFISFLVENNTHANVMKDYLRFQYNNSKSHNFIAMLAIILESFLPDNKMREFKNKSDINTSNKNNFENQFNSQGNLNTNINQNYKSENLIFDKRKMISLYYSMIIKTIESLTKCCQGPSFENQTTLLNETNILEFISSILFKVSYRDKIVKFDATNLEIKNIENIINCKSLNLSRKKTSFLKYKLLILLISFSEGRKKNDKIYEKIVKVIDTHSLFMVMTETVREMMLEKEVKNLQSLIMVDNFYQRFEKIIFDDPKIDENKNFIIFEIGTYIYIILNMYNENINKTKADTLLFSINEMKKKATNKKKIVLKDYFLRNTFNFFSKFYYVMKLFFIATYNCTCFKKKRIINDEEYEKFDIEEEKEFHKTCYEFFFNYTPNIEVIFYGHIIHYYIKLYPMCQYLSREMKDEFQDNVDRTNTKSKLNYLFKNLYYYKEALEYSQSLEEYFKKIPILDLILNQYLFWKDFSFIVTLVLNFMIISSYFKSDIINNKYNYSFQYINDPINIQVTNFVMYTFALIQFILSTLIFSNYIVKNLPKYIYTDKSDTKNTNNNQNTKFKRIITFLYRLISDKNFLYHLTYLIFSSLGFFMKEYFFFAFHLLEMVRRSTTLTNLLLAIWNPRKQLGVTLSLFVLFEYYFTIFIFLFMYDHMPDDSCYSFDRCMFTVYDQTFKNSNGMINFMSQDKYLEEYYLGARFWFDNLFCIVLIMLILQMIAGIIIDNFSALRENQQLVHEDRYNVCYICGLHKNDLNKLYGNEEGYTEHIKLDHYYWNFIFLIFNLMRKNPKELSGIDSYIYNNFEHQNYCWVPLGICSKKEDENKNELNQKTE